MYVSILRINKKCMYQKKKISLVTFSQPAVISCRCDYDRSSLQFGQKYDTVHLPIAELGSVGEYVVLLELS